MIRAWCGKALRLPIVFWIRVAFGIGASERIDVMEAFFRKARASGFVACAGVVCLALAACSQPVNHRPLSAADFQETSLQEIFEDRFWGDELPPNFEERVSENARLLKERYPGGKDPISGTDPYSRLLAISGGGANGAFGAGVLAGWTESGKRIEFDVVTGVSTGAIIAPFAFLGPDYDEIILDIYASGAREDVFELTFLGGLLFGSALADTAPLRRQIENHVTLELIEAIAEEHEKGRDLYIITTHFDARRPVVWNVGAIAARRDQEAVRLIRKIIQASTAIPVFFPPVPIEFELGERTFTELHVDGGLSHSVFAYPSQIPVARMDEMLGVNFRREIYLIVNSNKQTRYDPAPAGTLSIAGRAVRTLLQNQLNADVERIFRVSRRDGIAFKMISIPESFEATGSTDFDSDYMQAVWDVGKGRGRTGACWRDRPYSIGPEE